MKAYENLIHITPDMVVLESIGTTISPMTGLTYAIMQDGKHYDPDTETYIGEIDVDEYMGTISNDDEITFMALQDQELNDYKFEKGGSLVGTLKERYINFLKENNVDVDRYKFKYIKSGLYGEEEVWTHLAEKTGKNSGFITTTDTFDMLLSGEYGVDDFIYGNGLITRFEKGGSVSGTLKHNETIYVQELEKENYVNLEKLQDDLEATDLPLLIYYIEGNISQSELYKVRKLIVNQNATAEIGYFDGIKAAKKDKVWANNMKKAGKTPFQETQISIEVVDRTKNRDKFRKITKELNKIFAKRTDGVELWKDGEEISGWYFSKGGSVDKDLPYLIYVSNTNNPNPNKQLVAKVRSKGDAILIQSELSKNVAEAPLEYFLQDK